MDTCGAMTMKFRPSAIIEPQTGVGGGGPSPRKESPASVRMAPDTYSAACTMIGASTFGSTWRRRIASVPTPTSRAASTYGSSLTASTSPRVTRAKGGTNPTATATMTFRTPKPMIAMVAIARKITGKANSPSMTRMITASTRPP